jgi:uncharacterized protein (TIGR03118 family)
MKRLAKFCKWAVATAAALALPGLVCAQHYTQTNLVSDIPGMAPETDPHLRNAWGLSRSASSPWWVSNNTDGTSTLYKGDGTIVPLVVTIPAPKGEAGPGAPTGTVFNGTTDFELAPGKPALFLFATATGTISGWNPQVDGTNAILKVDNFHKRASYTGLALSQLNGKNVLYVANFHSGEVEVYDTKFQRVELGGNAFEDNSGGEHLAPFNVQTVGSNIFVTFAKPGPDGREVQGDGLGFVDVFSPDGRLMRRLDRGSWFNAPWGVVVAPGDFGEFSHDILVGNLGSGKIAAFNPESLKFRGFFRNPDNSVMKIDGLWALSFGNNAQAGPSLSLYFTAGPNEGKDGLYGSITPVPAELNLEIRP